MPCGCCGAKAAEEEKLAILRREVAIGLEQAHTGQLSKRTVGDILAELEAEDERQKK